MKTKKLKVLAMIILTSALLILASSASISTVKAQSTTTLFLYTTLGSSSVSANGTALTAGSSNTLTSGDTYTFTATPDSGWTFVCFEYASAAGAVGSTKNPYSTVVSSACSLEAVYIPTSNATGTTSGSGSSTITLFATAGGTTSPAGSTTGASISGTIGTATTLTETPSSSTYTFLCWVTQCSSSDNYYTTSTLSYKPLTSGVAIEPIWIPASFTLTLPTPAPSVTPKPTPEYSSAALIAIVAALVALAAATVVYKKTRK